MAGKINQKLKSFLAKLFGIKNDSPTSENKTAKKSKEMWVNGKLVEQ